MLKQSSTCLLVLLSSTLISFTSCKNSISQKAEQIIERAGGWILPTFLTIRM
jgi:hypothetical protein